MAGAHGKCSQGKLQKGGRCHYAATLFPSIPPPPPRLQLEGAGPAVQSWYQLLRKAEASRVCTSPSSRCHSPQQHIFLASTASHSFCTSGSSAPNTEENPLRVWGEESDQRGSSPGSVRSCVTSTSPLAGTMTPPVRVCGGKPISELLLLPLGLSLPMCKMGGVGSLVSSTCDCLSLHALLSLWLGAGGGWPEELLPPGAVL